MARKRASVEKRQMTPLERRTVEIELVRSFVAVLEGEYGKDAAKAVLRKVVEKAASDAAKSYLSRYPKPTLKILFEIWKELGGDGRLDLQLDELTERTLRFHVDRCSYAEMYRSRGLEELGIAFSCRRDEPFAKALIPGVEVRQSKTILEGETRCDFEYSLED